MNLPSRCLLILSSVVALSACEDGRVSVELSADRPAVAATQQVVVQIAGVTLRRTDGSLDRYTFDDPLRVDLMRFDRNAFSLLGAEGLDEGEFNGIRIDFSDSDRSDTDNLVVDANGAQRPLDIVADDADFAALTLKVNDNGRTYVVQTRLDLRLSLAANGDRRELRPVLRAARDSRAGQVSGSVRSSLISASSCRQNRNEGVGVAIYAFRGRDVTPNDADGTEPAPLASAPVSRSGSSGDWSYTLPLLPSGDYTLALTCNGDIEDAARDDDLDFVGDTRSLTLDDGDEQDEDFN